ncbi:MAG: type I methionyl aminopeptidase [bacterium]
MNKLVAMTQGGAILGQVRQALYHFTQVGVTPHELEMEARRLIKSLGGELSFTKVPGYSWATCVNLNSGIVHGIPTSTAPFQDGDLITVDVGVYYRGFHTDAAFSKVVGTTTPAKTKFLQAGMEGLNHALAVIKPGAHIGEIGNAMTSTLTPYGYSCTRELTAHGVGRELHEDPMISNLATPSPAQTPTMTLGQTLAIEIIYVEGKPELILEEDGWTITVKDGTLSAVFEETVAVTKDGYSVLTMPSLFQIL